MRTNGTDAASEGRALFTRTQADRRVEFVCKDDGYLIRRDGQDLLRWGPDEFATALEVFLGYTDTPTHTPAPAAVAFT
jgi:hypothetical protein